jgi:hypothetical protein
LVASAGRHGLAGWSADAGPDALLTVQFHPSVKEMAMCQWFRDARPDMKVTAGERITVTLVEPEGRMA